MLVATVIAAAFAGIIREVISRQQAAVAAVVTVGAAANIDNDDTACSACTTV